MTLSSWTGLCWAAGYCGSGNTRELLVPRAVDWVLLIINLTAATSALRRAFFDCVECVGLPLSH